MRACTGIALDGAGLRGRDDAARTAGPANLLRLIWNLKPDSKLKLLGVADQLHRADLPVEHFALKALAHSADRAAKKGSNDWTAAMTGELGVACSSQMCLACLHSDLASQRKGGQVLCGTRTVPPHSFGLLERLSVGQNPPPPPKQPCQTGFQTIFGRTVSSSRYAGRPRRQLRCELVVLGFYC